MGILSSARNLPDYISNLMIVIEMATLIIISNNKVLSFIIEVLDTESSIIQIKGLFFIGIITLLLQVTWDVSIIRQSYLLNFLQFDYTDTLSLVLVILTFVSLLLDFVKSVNPFKKFHNKWSQKYNEMKLLGYLINIGAVVVLPYKKLVPIIIIAALFLAYYLLRKKYQIYNKETQKYFQILIISGLSVSFSNLIRIYKDTQVYVDILIFLGLLVFNFILDFSGALKWNIKKDLKEIQQILQKQKLVETSVSIFLFLQSSHFDIDSRIRLQNFFTHSILKQKEQHQQKTRETEKKKCLQALLQFATTYKQKHENDFEFCFLLAELEIEAYNNLVGCQKIAHQIQNKVLFSWRSWITRIQIKRLMQFIQFHVNNNKQIYKKNYVAQQLYQGFIANYQFIKIISQAANQYHKMWEQFINVYPLLSELDQRLDSVLFKVNKVQDSYKQTKQYKSKYSALIYYNYLTLINKDTQLSKQIKLDFESLKSKTPDFMPYQDSIFASISLQGKFIEVGQNVVGILNYTKDQLKGRDISVLVPDFCRSKHRQLFTNFLDFSHSKQSSIQRLMKFHKQTVCVDGLNNLKRIAIHADLFFINESLQLIGKLTFHNEIKQIIAFQETGKIMIDNCKSQAKYIQNLFNKTAQQIIERLMTKQFIQMIRSDHEYSINSQYSLMQIIDNYQQKKIYILGRRVEEINATINGVSNFYSFIKQDKQQIQQNPLQKVQKEYKIKHTLKKCLLKSFFLVLFPSLLILSTSIFIATNSQQEHASKILSQTLRVFETGSIYAMNLASKIYYSQLYMVKNFIFSAMDTIPYSDLVDLAQSTFEAFDHLSKIEQPIFKQYFSDQQFQAKALLILQTYVVIADWMNMDVFVYQQTPRAMSNVRYTLDNNQMLLKDLLPMYEKTMEKLVKLNNQKFMQRYLIQFVLHIILIVIVILLIVYFSNYIENQNNSILQSVLALQNEDLTDKIKNMQAFKQIIHCAQYQQLIIKADRDNEQIISYQDKSVLRSHNESGGQTVNQLIIKGNKNRMSAKNNQNITEYQPEKKIKIRNTTKVISNYEIVFYSVIFIITCGLLINSGIFYYVLRDQQSSLVVYIDSIISLKSTFYVYEVMYSTVLLNACTNNEKLDLIKEAMNNFTKAASQLQHFNPSLFKEDQFQQFRMAKQDLQFRKICEQFQCVMYSLELNLPYYESTQYSYKVVEKMHDELFLRNESITADDDKGLNYLIYAQEMYLKIIQKTFDSAFKGIQQHLDHRAHQVQIKLIIQVSISLILLISCLYKITVFWMKRYKAFRLFKLFNRNLTIQNN